MLFLILRDGTGLCQCVVEKTMQTRPCSTTAKHLGAQESSLEMTGNVRAEERAVGGHELALTGVTIVQNAEGTRSRPSRTASSS
jgi:asparaginyl-tRNA synthetase